MAFKFQFSGYACFLGALLIIMFPVRWWMGALLAAFFHELCHLAVIYLTGSGIMGVSVGSSGTRIEAEILSKGREALCSAAGPLGSFLFAWIMRRFPEASICALFQGMYNLLPVYPLDGGRLIRCILSEPLSSGIEICTLILVFGFGLWCAVELNLGITAMIPGCILAFRCCNRKFPCKETNLAVQ